MSNRSLAAVFFIFAPLMTAANYTAQEITVDGFSVVRLSDAAHHTEVSIVPGIGNIAYDMKVNGKPLLWQATSSPAQLRSKPTLMGVPFLAPWANRLDQEAFYANGKKYLLNPGLGNVRLDGNRQPIHGLLSFVPDWRMVSLRSGDAGAEVTSRLDFWRHPTWMAQFPFAHTIEMTYRLSNGGLEVHTAIHNESTEPMPVSVAFHPYYQITDAPRDEWRVHLAVDKHYALSPTLIPTGETKPYDQPDPLVLAGHQLDDVFGAVEGGEFSVQGKSQKISIRFGPKYKVAVVYAPPGREFICFEPMSGVTNAFNLNHAGLYPELQSIAPGQTWQESFWILPSGY